jgi:hypothetical protein
MTQLETAKKALENRNKEKLVEMSAGIREEFRDRRQEEDGLNRLAQEVRTSAESESVADIAVRYIELVGSIEASRAQASEAILNYTLGEDTVDAALQKVNGLLTTRKEIQSVAEDIRSASSGVSVPPILVLDGDSSIEVPKGTRI